MRVICDRCKKEFNKKPSELGKLNFCSRECYKQFKKPDASSFIEYYKIYGNIEKTAELAGVTRRAAVKIFKKENLWKFSKCKYCNNTINDKDRLPFLINICKDCERVYYQSAQNKFKETCLQKYKTDNPFKNKTIKNKIKITLQNKYGVTNISQNSHIKDKKKETTRNNYGVDFPLQSDEIKNKVYATNLQKYGTKSPLQNSSVRQKQRITNISRYGHPHTLGSTKIREKIKKTNILLYGGENPSYSNDVRRKIQISKRNNYWEVFLEKINKKRLVPLFEKNYYLSFHTPLTFKCKSCGNIIKTKESNPQKIYCNCIFKRSRYEDDIIEWLKTIGISDITPNKKFFEKGKQKYEIDIWIESKNIGIDFHGLFWHSDINLSTDYHKNKSSYFRKKAITYIQVFENEWLLQQDIVKSIIKNKLRLNKKIYARNCTICPVSAKEADTFISKNHLQKNVPSQIRFGLYLDNKIVAIATFGKSRFDKHIQWELLRFCTKIDIHVIGGFQKLLKHFEKLYVPQSIISYIDLRYFTGNGYKKANFYIDGETPPNYYYFKKNDLILHNRINFQKHKLKDKLVIFDENKTEYENMLDNNYLRIFDAGNIRVKKIA